MIQLELTPEVKSGIDDLIGGNWQHPDYEKEFELYLQVIKKLNISDPIELEKAVLYIFTKLKDYTEGFLFTNKLINFISSLVDGFENKDILLPWQEIGTLTLTIINQNPNQLTCVIPDINHAKSFQSILKNSLVINNELRQFLKNNDKQYDLIIGADSSFRKGFQFVENDVEIKPDFIDCFVARSLEKLNQSGHIVLIVDSSFVNKKNRKHSLLYNLSKLGGKLTAVIDLPSNYARINFPFKRNLVVIKKGIQKKVMSGLFSDDKKSQETLISNYKNETNGKQANLGHWEVFSELEGFHKINLLHGMQRLANRTGLTKFSMLDIALSVNSIDRNKDKDFHIENSVYFPKNGYGEAVSSVEDIRDKSKHLFQISFDPEVVNSQYFSYFLNKSDIGRKFRWYTLTDSIFPSLSKQALINSSVYLPQLEVQNNVIKSQLKIHELKNELNELQEKIWHHPNKIDKLDKLIKNVNHKEGFIDWVETLPFPLASILWSYHTQCDTEKEKLDKLLHFFEASSELFSVIHLSALYSSDDLIDEILSKLTLEMNKHNMKLEMATFGVWVTVFEFLAKSIRKKLDKDRDFIMKLYGLQNFELLSNFVGKRFVTLFKKTNSIRNKHLGHSGAMSMNLARNIHLELSNLLAEFREISIGLWDQYHFLVPDTFKQKGGQLFCNVRKIMGTRTPFVKDEVNINSVLEEGRLHLYSNSTQNAIELLPFIKIMPSPKTQDDACYFYNRMDASKESRFISYHYEGDPEAYLTSDSINHVIDRLKQE